jgi:hypothetical protein
MTPYTSIHFAVNRIKSVGVRFKFNFISFVHILMSSVSGFHRGGIILVKERGGTLIYTMNPWKISNKRRGECSYHTPIRALFSTMKSSLYIFFFTVQYTGTIIYNVTMFCL